MAEARRTAVSSPNEELSGQAACSAQRRQPKTSERIARILASRIVDRQLEPGTRLPPEKEMVETFGVGRTTLREALRLLETRGVITIKTGPGGGPVVRRPRASDLSEALTLILEFERSPLNAVFEARVALEPTLARLAATRIDNDRVELLQRSVDAMLADLNDHDTFLAENQRFHSLIAEVAGNAVLSVFVETLKAVADGALMGVRYTPNRRRAVAAAHQRIVDALRAGDAFGAEEAMKQHLDEAGRYWSRKYGSLLSDPLRWAD